MQDISLHILDIMQNSIAAGASHIKIVINEDPEKDLLSIEIEDDGSGMEKELLGKVQDPFVTTRKTRKIGLGIPLFKASAERCEGSFRILSEPGRGTVVYAEYRRSNIDVPPMGDIAGTVVTAVTANPDINYRFIYRFKAEKFVFETAEIKAKLGEVPVTNPDVIQWMLEYINEGIRNITGGV